MYKIVLDAGHGGKDPGAVNGSHQEKVYALDIVKRLGKILSGRGVNVLYTREDDTYPTLRDRTDYANEVNADYFISIHLNSAANSTAKGIETLIYGNGGNAEALAEKVQASLINATDAINRGVKVRTNLAVLKNTNMPAILVETGFISNPEEVKKLATEQYREILAKAIADGVSEYLNIPASKMDGNVFKSEENIVKEEIEVIRTYRQLEDFPEWARVTMQKLINKGAIRKNSNGEYKIYDSALQVFVANDRCGLY